MIDGVGLATGAFIAGILAVIMGVVVVFSAGPKK